LASAAESLRGFREEETTARGASLPSLVEYLETGGWSMPMPNVIATASCLYHLDVVNRRRDYRVVDLERYLSAYTRLENDLEGIEKERREQSPSNAVLLMERYMSNEQAKEFVLRQKQGYVMLVNQGLHALGPEDPLGRFMRATMTAHEKWYGHTPDRYDAAQRRAQQAVSAGAGA
jgi:hypothetical protein